MACAFGGASIAIAGRSGWDMSAFLVIGAGLFGAAAGAAVGHLQRRGRFKVSPWLFALALLVPLPLLAVDSTDVLIAAMLGVAGLFIGVLLTAPIEEGEARAIEQESRRSRKTIAGRPVMVWVIAMVFGWVAVEGILQPWIGDDLARADANYVSRPLEFLIALASCVLLAAVVVMLARRRIAFELWIASTVAVLLTVVARAAAHAPYRDVITSSEGILIWLAFYLDLSIIRYLRTLSRDRVLR